jgi:hypothetical protein
MMNVTLSIDEDLVERAREVARQQGKSLNALIREYLQSLTAASRGENLAGQFQRLWAERTGHSGGWHFDREALYEERIDRRPGGTGD